MSRVLRRVGCTPALMNSSSRALHCAELPVALRLLTMSSVTYGVATPRPPARKASCTLAASSAKPSRLSSGAILGCIATKKAMMGRIASVASCSLVATEQKR
jgi:hypothetical protein